MTLFIIVITCTVMIAIAFMAWLVIDLVSDLNNELSNWADSIDAYQAGRKVGLFINRFLNVVSPFTRCERTVNCGRGYTMTIKVIPMGIRKAFVMSIERFVSRAVNVVITDSMIDAAIARSLESRVSARLGALTSEPMEREQVIPLDQRKYVETKPVVSKPVAPASLPVVPAPAALPSLPVTQAKCDADGNVQSVYCEDLNMTIPINGRFNAMVSPRSGQIVQWTSGKGKEMIGVIAGTTTKVGSDSLIVRPLKDDLSGATSFCIPVSLDKIKGLQVAKPLPKPKTVVPPAPTVAKKRGKSTVQPVVSAPVNVQAVEVNPNDPRLASGELIVIVHQDGSIESTKTGEVKRFNPKGNNGFSVALRKHRAVTPTSKVFFASDLGL